MKWGRPSFFYLFPPYLNDRLVWRIRSFMMLICPLKLFGRVSLFPHNDGVFTVRQIGSEFTLVVGNRFGCHFALDGVRPESPVCRFRFVPMMTWAPDRGTSLGRAIWLSFLLVVTVPFNPAAKTLPAIHSWVNAGFAAYYRLA